MEKEERAALFPRIRITTNQGMTFRNRTQGACQVKTKITLLLLGTLLAGCSTFRSQDQRVGSEAKQGGSEPLELNVKFRADEYKDPARAKQQLENYLLELALIRLEHIVREKDHGESVAELDLKNLKEELLASLLQKLKLREHPGGSVEDR